jgi:hypothetical protein
MNTINQALRAQSASRQAKPMSFLTMRCPFIKSEGTSEFGMTKYRFFTDR